MNYIEQRGGPNKGIPGVGGVMNGEAIVDSWMVMDFGNGGAGGGGAPYGSAGDFDAGEEFLDEPIPIHKIESSYKRIAQVLNQYVFTPACTEKEKVRHFETNGLDPDSIGSDTYYDPDLAASSRPVTSSSYGGLQGLGELEGGGAWGWQIHGTWRGPFWPPDPFPTSDYVTRLITVRGPTVFSHNSRNLDLTVTPAEGGEGYVSKVGGAGGSTVFNAGKPDSDDFNGKYQGDDDCTVNVNTRINDLFQSQEEPPHSTPWQATDNSFWGDEQAAGAKGADVGERAGDRSFTSENIASPYGSEYYGLYLGNLHLNGTSFYAAHAGWAILQDNDSTVSYVDKDGELKGREDYDLILPTSAAGAYPAVGGADGGAAGGTYRVHAGNGSLSISMRGGAGAASMHNVRAIDFMDAGGILVGSTTLTRGMSYAPADRHWTVNEGGRSLTIGKWVMESTLPGYISSDQWTSGSGRYLRLHLDEDDLFVDTPVITTENPWSD